MSLEVINVAGMKEVGTFMFAFPEGITNDESTKLIRETGARIGNVYYDDKNSAYHYAYCLDVWYGWDQWVPSNFAVVVPNEYVYDFVRLSEKEELEC